MVHTIYILNIGYHLNKQLSIYFTFSLLIINVFTSRFLIFTCDPATGWQVYSYAVPHQLELHCRQQLSCSMYLIPDLIQNRDSPHNAALDSDGPKTSRRDHSWCLIESSNQRSTRDSHTWRPKIKSPFLLRDFQFLLVTQLRVGGSIPTLCHISLNCIADSGFHMVCI